ncbi:DgyrCDS7546 [Dimorphilus gyrociliatus]|uniref:Sidoreflexin n=1 Tax=Dimorphilus gyrociliatus TaxID=2664684 RepID=A0A7I8VT24_9ANNE|nr:DgyrCDS7546 [Dimorphilus gyrociliatus]
MPSTLWLKPRNVSPNDVDEPLWDQKTFMGRLHHFFWVTDWRTVPTSNSRLFEAKQFIEDYKSGKISENYDQAKIRYEKKLKESAFHPDSGELQNNIGRMSFQVPGGMVITGGMLQYYRSTGAVILWQWINQSFNALVNYTNRNAASPITTTQMTIAYASATSAAVLIAVGLKGRLARTVSSPVLQRFVPWCAVAAANLVNIPFTRQRELVDGVMMSTEDGEEIAKSRFAAAKGISQVVAARITMASPGMLLLPFIMERLEKRPWFMRYPRGHIVFQTLVVGAFLTVMTPIGCAIFPQKCSVSMETLKFVEKDVYQSIKKNHPDKSISHLYFNKGL